jgi:hypothetical protein
MACYFGGGGGASNFTSSASGAGGSGGGGGGSSVYLTPGTAGTVNTGGGGGGAAFFADTSGAGGSGVVILKYVDTKTITIGAGLTGSESASSGGFKRATITAGTGNVSWV